MSEEIIVADPLIARRDRKQYSLARRIRLWFQYRFRARLRDAKYWVIHRTFDRYHVIRCDGLGPGYYDKDDQMLHAVMGLVVDFVEIESKMMEDWEKRPWQCRWIPFMKFRSAESGLRHLDWEMGLRWDESHGTYPEDEHYGEPTGQAKRAAVIKEVYLWWTQARPARPDHNQGYHDLYVRAENGEDIPREAFSAEAIRSHEIEQVYDEEDNLMLKKVVDVRLGMWT